MKCGDEGREGCEGKKQKGKRKAARRRRGKKKACVKGQKAASKRREGRGGAVLGVCAVRAGWLVGKRVCNVSCVGGAKQLSLRVFILLQPSCPSVNYCKGFYLLLHPAAGHVFLAQDGA